MRSPALLLSAATAALLVAGTARADIPPPPDSPDAHCTLEEQCKSGVLCPYAFNPGGDPEESAKVGEDCRKDAEAKGLQRRCRNGSNYSGDHLYCPPGETGTWSAGGQPTPTPGPGNTDPPKTEAAKSGCSIGGTSGGAALALLGLLFARRRRR